MVRRGGTANEWTRKLSSEATAPIGAQSQGRTYHCSVGGGIQICIHNSFWLMIAYLPPEKVQILIKFCIIWNCFRVRIAIHAMEFYTYMYIMWLIEPNRFVILGTALEETQVFMSLIYLSSDSSQHPKHVTLTPGFYEFAIPLRRTTVSSRKVLAPQGRDASTCGDW